MTNLGHRDLLLLVGFGLYFGSVLFYYKHDSKNHYKNQKDDFHKQSSFLLLTNILIDRQDKKSRKEFMTNHADKSGILWVVRLNCPPIY